MKEEILKREISSRFKPVEYIRVEEDFRQDREFVGEYSRISYAVITNKKDSYYHQTRPVLEVTIRFTDNTGFKTHLKPEDYLGKITEEIGDLPAIIGKDMFQRNERPYDFNKILKTLISQLKGEKVENPTLEAVDYLLTA